MTTNNAIRAIVEYRNSSQPLEVAANVLHFLTDGTQDDAADQIRDQIKLNAAGGWYFEWKQNATTTYSMTALRIYDLETDPPTLLIEELYDPATYPGTASGNPLPPQMAIGLSLRSSQLGRRGRGRVYLPGASVNILSTTTGEMSTGSAQGIANNFANFRDACFPLTNVLAWGVFSRVNNQVYDVVDVAVGIVLDTIRRRRNKIAEAYQVGV